ncbi:MAG: PAS domain S-box protein [Alphaproteobacteria bacterium]|nr:PAS domain S-box protein [Alphaproteobacteria bacterium]
MTCYIVFSVLIVALIGLAVWSLLLYKNLNRTKHSLKELLKEQEDKETSPQENKGDIYFKIDSEFNITYINEIGAKILGFEADELHYRSVLGSIVEDSSSQKEALIADLNRMRKNQNTINSQIILVGKDGQKKQMLCRQRPILNEILECEGISFLCKDISEASAWKQNLNQFQKTDIFTNTLNEGALLHKFAHDFRLACRYNREFSCVVIELKDVYEFISRGIDFETADKMLKAVSEVCLSLLPEKGSIGRVDKTKFFMFINEANRQQAKELAFKIFEASVPAIKGLRVDEANAQMMVVTYTNRRNFNDTYDAMLSRVRRHINTALRHREYGIVSSDERGARIESKREEIDI